MLHRRDHQILHVLARDSFCRGHIPQHLAIIRWRRGLAVCAAFLGVLIIVRPGFKELLPGHFVALASALCSAAVVITGRMIG